MSRRLIATVAVLALGVAGCSGTTPSPAPTASTSTSASATPSGRLLAPGEARKAVDALVAASDGLPVVKVDVDASSATLSALKGTKVMTWEWGAGTVTQVESDVADIKQATFDPARYRFDDLSGIFATAAKISGSASNQELQIVEYDHGQVAMTVTTRPESEPVFFRPDGTPINQLDYPRTAAFTEALADVSADGHRVLAIGWSAGDGFWADQPHPGDDAIVDRITRQAKVPAWTASRKADATGPTFVAADVDPAVLSRLITQLPTRVGQPGATVSFTIERVSRMATPVVRFDVGGQQVVTTLGGTDITATVGG